MHIAQIPGVATARESEPAPAEPEGAAAHTVRRDVKPAFFRPNAPDPPGAHYDDDELSDVDTEIPGVHAIEIPGVHTTADTIPGVPDAKIPGVPDAKIAGVTDAQITGVDGDAEHAPESVEIQDLANIAPEAEPVAPAPISQQAEPKGTVAQKAEPEAPAPIARPAEPKGAVAAATKNGSEKAATEDGSEAANQVGHEAVPKDGSDRNVEAATTVRRDVKPRSMEIPTQTATAPQLESHRVPNPDAHVFVIEDGSEAAPEVGHEAANKVGKRNAKDDGNKTADDDWIEVRLKQHRRCKHMTLPPTLTAKGTAQHFERASQRRTARKFSHC